MCYVGKATKIFIFIVAALVVTGLVLGFGLFRSALHKSHKCSGDSCNDQASPAVFPNPTTPSTPTSASTLTPTPNPSSNPYPPPPAPNPGSTPTPPPPPPEVMPPPPQPVVVAAAPPPNFGPPSPVVTPGPVQSSVALTGEDTFEGPIILRVPTAIIPMGIDGIVWPTIECAFSLHIAYV
ncbi:uncharacterized protein Os04g0629400-like [Rhododendron vialii]|uniref:uncharacterized protein Os04g0629400-like n=1 Tax=Rhododendron vialii TaxID=182163 RepID=UPI00265E35C3|nr:uncharacterized protein Os04g0629400-like [Rhododendron vialii]